jgi:hypothetical protein
VKKWWSRNETKKDSPSLSFVEDADKKFDSTPFLESEERDQNGSGAAKAV